jgi:hypothetical protein
VAALYDGSYLRVILNGSVDGLLLTTKHPKAGHTPLILGAKAVDNGDKFQGEIIEVRVSYN